MTGSWQILDERERDRMFGIPLKYAWAEKLGGFFFVLGGICIYLGIADA